MPGRSTTPILLIAIDGLGPQAAVRLMNAGRLPNLRTLMHAGQRHRIRRTVPEDPAVLWADLASGHIALEHGVLSTVKLSGEGVRMTTASDWRVDPIWSRVAREGRRAAVINWPASSQADAGQRLSIVSDRQINDSVDPADRSARRLQSGDIPPSLVEELIGDAGSSLHGLPADDIRKVGLAALLARSGTIQNAAVDAIGHPEGPPDLAMIRIDLPTLMAELVIPRPGVFDRGGSDTSDHERQLLLDNAGALTDLMIGELRRRMPEQSAVMIVGLLDYNLNDSAWGDTEHEQVVINRVNGVEVWGEQRRALACQRPGGFAVWYDTRSPMQPGGRARDTDLHVLHRYLTDRLKLAPPDYPPPVRAASLLGLEGPGRDRDARHALENPGVWASRPALAWESAAHHRAVNLARAASRHGRWRFACHAWDVAIEREDRFAYHAMHLEALLHAKHYDAFDERLMRWLVHLPDQPVLRRLAESRDTIDDPPAPAWSTPDTPSCLNVSRVDQPQEPERYRLWNAFDAEGLGAIQAACQSSVDACREQYNRFARAWGACQALRDAESPAHSSETDHSPAMRAAESLAGQTSFLDRHGAAGEVDQTLAGNIERVDRISPHPPYTEPWLMDLHRCLFEDPDAFEHAGRYRDRLLEGGGRLPRLDGRLITSEPVRIPCFDLPATTRRLLEHLRYQLADRTPDVLLVALLAQITLQKVHPFADGNGRTGRSLMLHVLKHHGWPVIGHARVELWLERKREPFLGHALALSQRLDHETQRPPDRLIQFLRFSISILQQACSSAADAAEHLARSHPPA